jgi:hypothetical protein
LRPSPRPSQIPAGTVGYPHARGAARGCVCFRSGLSTYQTESERRETVRDARRNREGHLRRNFFRMVPTSPIEMLEKRPGVAFGPSKIDSLSQFTRFNGLGRSRTLPRSTFKASSKARHMTGITVHLCGSGDKGSSFLFRVGVQCFGGSARGASGGERAGRLPGLPLSKRRCGCSGGGPGITASFPTSDGLIRSDQGPHIGLSLKRLVFEVPPKTLQCAILSRHDPLSSSPETLRHDRFS